MQIYDYLFSGVIIIALLLGSTVMVTMLSSPVINASDKDLLKITSEKIMTQLLLDSGYPYNWGSENVSQQNLKVFGLAKYGETTRQAYELDPDKVLRIDNALEGTACNFVDAVYAAGLLSLNNTHGTLDYGFTLEFKETLQLSLSCLGSDEYSVKVQSDYDLPIIEANVSAVLYYLDGSSIAHAGPVYNTTTYDGSCILDLSGSSAGTAKVLAVVVDYCGSYATKIYSNVGTSVLNATLFGSSLIPSSNPPYPEVDEVGSELVLIQTSQGHETRDFPVSVSANLTLTSSLEPSAVAVLAVSGNKLLVASRDFSNISYRTIPQIVYAPSAYSLERTVLIAGSTYTATLYFWRMSS
jgi:hypothetical protein